MEITLIAEALSDAYYKVKLDNQELLKELTKCQEQLQDMKNLSPNNTSTVQDEADEETS